MRAKFKVDQLVKIVGKDVPPECKYKTGKIKEIEIEQSGGRLRYIIQVKGSDRWFHQDELEEIVE